MSNKPEKDDVTGKLTTGHEWDGIKELNTPSPKWWLYVFAATVVWSIGFVILYPSLPGINGLAGYSSRVAVKEEIAAAEEEHAAYNSKIASTGILEVAADYTLREIALTIGKSIFTSNCVPCHGVGGSGLTGRPGYPGYPVLAGNDWLWGGKLTDIQHTIQYGVRNGHKNARDTQMPSFGEILKPEEISSAADYVLSLSGDNSGDPVAIKAGSKIFADNCAVCHGEKGIGNRDVGAPKLANRPNWLYGGDKASVIAQITKPQMGVMPPWAGKLSDAEIKSVSIYVHSLSGGE